MTPLTAPTPVVVDVTRLAPLPRVGAMRRELAVKDTRDALIPPHERHAVTVGECLEALGLPLLTGEHARSRVAQTVAGADLAGIVPRPMEAAPGPDTRVGRARAALWTMGLEGVYGAVIRQAIRRYALELRRRHPDTTSLTVDGADEREAAAEGPGGPCGSRREHRPDLTPRLVGRTGTAEGVPVGGHVTAGHGSARPASRCHRPQRRQPLPDVGEPLLGAASQVFAGEGVALAAEPRCRFGTGGPQTVGRRPEVGESPAWGAWPWRWARAGRRTGETAPDHGGSGGRAYWGQTAAGARPERPWRCLVVESTPRATAQAPRAAAAPQVERAALVTLQAQWPRRPLAGEAEAPQAATLCRRELAVHCQPLPDTGGPAGGPATRPTRGRPPKTAPRPQRHVWRVLWPGPEATALITARTRRDRRVVLATQVLEAEPLSEAERLRASKGQPAAELRCKWAKNPAAMAPLFLETPTRLAALGWVSLSARLRDTLVARHVRNSLAARGEPVPDRPAPSPRPTARTVFQRRRTLAVVTVVGAGPRHRQVTPLNAVQGQVISLLGDASAISTRPHRNSG